MLAIICPPGWDRVNWSAKIFGYNGTLCSYRPCDCYDLTNFEYEALAMTGNGNYVNWKAREIVSGELIFGGFLSLGTNVCCKANLVCSDWEAAAWCCWNRASKEKERKLPFHRWESSNFFFRFSSDAPSEPTHSISSFFYFFFSMLAPAAAALHC